MQVCLATGNDITVSITTTEYGQVEALLAEAEAGNATNIIVAGPIDESDFQALNKYAVKGKYNVVDLQGAEIKDNTVPDLAFCGPFVSKDRLYLGIKKIILPEGIVKIGKWAFAFTELEEINIPSSLRELGDNAFLRDTCLNCPIVLPEGVEEIGDNTFNQCFKLSIPPVLPSTLKRIGEWAFAYTTFKTIEFNDGLEYMGYAAFFYSGLEEVILPNSIVELGGGTFALSEGLRHASLPASMKDIIWDIFRDCTSLQKVDIPEGVKSIGNSAFDRCKMLKEIMLPSTLESIEPTAFESCPIQTIDFPAHLKYLGYNCFARTNLRTIYCESLTPPEFQTSLNPFDEACYANAVVYVHFGCKEKYQEHWGWCKFKNIVETDEFPLAGISDAMGAPDEHALYDLQGRKVSQPLPGRVYIQNGKKVVLSE